MFKNIATGFAIASYILVVLIMITGIAKIWGYGDVELPATLLVLLIFTAVNWILFMDLSY